MWTTRATRRILGVREGASENAVVALGLLESLVGRGLDPGRARLFVLDGSKAVRWAAAAFLDAEKGYRRIMGYKDLWILKAHLDELGTPPVDGKEGCRVA